MAPIRDWRIRSIRYSLFLLSFFVVTFGQPAFSSTLGLIAAVCGYALFWGGLLTVERVRDRFLIAAGWYLCVQCVQLGWLLSHPYYYIIGVWIMLGVWLGLQFGVISLLVTRERLAKALPTLGIAALWTLFEWGRLYVLTGFPFDPVGLALTGYQIPLQFAAVWGIYGLSFWVMAVNLFLLRMWIFRWKTPKPILTTVGLAVVPYLFGMAHLAYHDKEKALHDHEHLPFHAVLLNVSFLPEEVRGTNDPHEFIACAIKEWKHCLLALKKHQGQMIDLIVFPEGFVPFGADYPIYFYEEVRSAFVGAFGEHAVKALPPIEEPLAQAIPTKNGAQWLVSNAYWVQALMNMFQADVLIGLEDVVKETAGKASVYNAAVYFKHNTSLAGNARGSYGKQVLLPMAEYIPSDLCRYFCAGYGVRDSYKKGPGAKVFDSGKVLFGASVCYEEAFGELMLENRRLGANMLINITSDVWYPNSRLGQQHFDHARLRSVEMGVPLLRSCNYGVTAAVDSLGALITRSEDCLHAVEWTAQAVPVSISTYHYPTLYGLWGDKGIVAISSLLTCSLLLGLASSRKTRKK